MKLTNSQKKILHAIAVSTEIAYPGVSSPGELTYKQISKATGINITSLPPLVSAKSKKGTSYPNSLESLGLISSTLYELSHCKGHYSQTSILFFLTPKGEDLFKTLIQPPEIEKDDNTELEEIVSTPTRGRTLLVYSRTNQAIVFPAPQDC